MEVQKSKVINQNSKTLEIHNRTFSFSITLILFVERLPNNDVYRIVKNQVIRSGTSIGANLVEGKAASSKKEFIRYIEISLKSANETTYWLSILEELMISNSMRFEVIAIKKELNEICKVIATIVIKLKSN